MKRNLSRRQMVGLMAGLPVGAALTVARCGGQETGPGPASPPAPADDGALLLQLQRAAFAYGWFESNATTGLTLDRASNQSPRPFEVASIAATGFMLATLPIGIRRGYIRRASAIDRATRTIRTLLYDVEQHAGFLRHWVDASTCERRQDAEFSSIDTSLAALGALVAGEALGGEVKGLANQLYERIDWTAALDDDGLLRHGWTEPDKSLDQSWDTYSEGILCYLLALGSPTHPIPEANWLAFDRVVATYDGRPTFLGGLFLATYPAAFVDFRNRSDVRCGGLDYQALLRNMVWVNRQFCLQAPGGLYDAGFFGLSATDGPDGDYHAYSPLPPNHDGTINIPVLLSAVSLAPEIVLPAVRELYGTCGSYGRYGFSGADNRSRTWTNGQCIGIDTLCSVLGIENHLSGLVWRLFHVTAAAQRGLSRAGLRFQP